MLQLISRISLCVILTFVLYLNVTLTQRVGVINCCRNSENQNPSFRLFACLRLIFSLLTSCSAAKADGVAVTQPGLMFSPDLTSFIMAAMTEDCEVKKSFLFNLPAERLPARGRRRELGIPGSLSVPL